MDENNNYPDTVDSRSVDIIETIINQEEYDIPPQSRLEEVLLELKEAIEQGGGGSGNVYVTTTPLTDGATTNPILVNGESVTVDTGDIAVYDHKEFIWDGSAWDELGDLSGLGEMAFLNKSDMGELAFEDTSDLNLGELAMKDTDDIHSTLSDIEYEALPNAKKNDGTEYFVYETSEDNRTIIVKDANGNFKYSASIYGVVADGTPGWNKFATDSDAPTTPPTKVAPQLSGTSLIFSYTTTEKTVYFNRFGGYAPGAGGRAIDADASNCYFIITGSDNQNYSIVTAYDTLSGPFVSHSAGDVTYFGRIENDSGKICRNNKVYGIGGFTRTVLYDSGGYDRYAPFQTDISLLDNLSNYDFIVVSIGTDGDNTRVGKYECDSAVYDVQLILRNDYYAHYAGYQRRWCDIHFTNTTFNIMNSDCSDEDTSLKPCVYFIVGYKFG